MERINAIANPTLPKVGDKFLGTVVKTAAFGAFISLLRGRRFFYTEPEPVAAGAPGVAASAMAGTAAAPSAVKPISDQQRSAAEPAAG